MRTYLQAVVEEGTGYAAGIDGYTIGGKTGTAEKLPRGNGKYVLSFIGFTPVENPQVMLYVVVDEPHLEDQEGSGAGAKLFNQVMQDLLPYLNVYATNADDVQYDGTDETISSAFDEDDASADDVAGGEDTVSDDSDVTDESIADESSVDDASEADDGYTDEPDYTDDSGESGDYTDDTGTGDDYTDDSGYYDDTGTADDYTSDEDASGDYSYVDDGTE